MKKFNQHIVMAQKGVKCQKCCRVVSDKDFALECEISENWFHIKCEDISELEYKMLEMHKCLHWYCGGCNKSMMKVMKNMSVLQNKIEKLEVEVNQLKAGGSREGYCRFAK